MATLHIVVKDHAARERDAAWDAFLDLYSLYLEDPSLTHAASLHLASVALETLDAAFSARDFEQRLGFIQEP